MYKYIFINKTYYIYIILILYIYICIYIYIYIYTYIYIYAVLNTVYIYMSIGNRFFLCSKPPKTIEVRLRCTANWTRSWPFRAPCGAA